MSFQSDRSAVINVERSSKQDTASTFIFDLMALVDIAGAAKSVERPLTRSPPITSTWKFTQTSENLPARTVGWRSSWNIRWKSTNWFTSQSLVIHVTIVERSSRQVQNWNWRHHRSKLFVSLQRSDNLINHRRRHTGEHPYKCDRCNWTGPDSSSFIHHKKKHNEPVNNLGTISQGGSHPKPMLFTRWRSK